MRTNIDLDPDLLAQASKYSTARSKRGIIHEALATFVAVKSEERKNASYRDRLGTVRELASRSRLRSDTRDLLRQDRDSR